MKRIGIFSLGFVAGFWLTARAMGHGIMSGRFDDVIDKRVAMREMMDVLGTVAARQTA